MALFQRQERNTEVAALYTFGMQKTLLIVGLGNIGKKYIGTRHNIGFTCINAFADRNEFPQWHEKRDLKAYITNKTLGDTRIILVKPSTFMNNSGEAIQSVAHFYKVSVSDVAIVHDELDIPFGQIRMRTGGGSAGNNGIKSIIEHGYQDAKRIRIGVGADTPMDSAAFVLSKFGEDEQKNLKSLVNEVEAILTELVFSNQFTPETRTFIA